MVFDGSEFIRIPFPVRGFVRRHPQSAWGGGWLACTGVVEPGADGAVVSAAGRHWFEDGAVGGAVRGGAGASAWGSAGELRWGCGRGEWAAGRAFGWDVAAPVWVVGADGFVSGGEVWVAVAGGVGRAGDGGFVDRGAAGKAGFVAVVPGVGGGGFAVAALRARGCGCGGCRCGRGGWRFAYPPTRFSDSSASGRAGGGAAAGIWKRVMGHAKTHAHFVPYP